MSKRAESLTRQSSISDSSSLVKPESPAMVQLSMASFNCCTILTPVGVMVR